MMDSYTKVLHWGETLTDPLKNVDVIVEEKIDGSQFRVFCQQGTMLFGSKSITYDDAHPPDKMFELAIEQAKEVFKNYKDHSVPIQFFCEYLMKPKHNSIKYDRIPEHNLILFDVKIGSEFLNYDKKLLLSRKLGLEVPNFLWHGKGVDLSLDKIKELLERDSMLGKTKIEGIVIKNYELFHEVKYLLGKPIFAKYVSEEFKEVNKENWKGSTKGGFIEMLIAEYKTEVRWNKAVQHLRERGELTGSPKDIGNLLKEVLKDLHEEEADNIKDKLFEWFWKEEISRGVVHGLPQWYKDKLVTDEK